MGRFLSVMIILSLAPALLYPEQEGGSSPSILTHSPFLPPGFQPPGGNGPGNDPGQPVQSGQYEFRGVYQLGGLYYFHLYNTRDRKGTWVSENNSDGDSPKVVSFDRKEDTLLVDVGGKQVNLAMIETSDRTISMPSGTNPAPRISAAKEASIASPSPTAVRRRVIRPTTRSPGTPTVQPRNVIPENQPEKLEP
jgi:hypothetical protein